MKVIVEIDGAVSTRYRFNVWTVLELIDGKMEKNVRIFESDNFLDFSEFIRKLNELN